MKARESESDGTLVGDPVANGATVTIRANGEAGTSETYALPAGTSAVTAKPFQNSFKFFTQCIQHCATKQKGNRRGSLDRSPIASKNLKKEYRAV